MAEAILSTKLHPPKLPRGWLTRERLAKRLEEGSRASLTLVSAPAGYGKSTCVADWLGSRDEPSAWLSLEPADSDPVEFVRYAIAAVRTLFPEACPETQALLEAPELPPVSALARSLANELDAIASPFVLVLDDYQAIGDPAVHDLLAELLAHPPTCLYLVLITRRDPPLPLASLRGRGQLAEVSLHDLQFDRSESQRFLMESTGLSLSERSLAHLEDVLEGWPVGLRLVSLALADRADPEEFLCNLTGPTYDVQEYLVQEVLARTPADQQQWLLRTAILDRFCASLCEAVCAAEGDALGRPLDGKGFLEILQTSSLFTISLDEQGEWYRYHHTFHGVLRNLLESQYGPADIAALHSRAARWFAENDLPEEALDHALAAGDSTRARDLVQRNRNALMNAQQWARLERWLARLPGSLANEDPALLVAQAWCCEHRCRSCTQDHLDRAEEKLAARPAAASELEAVQGEVDALRAIHEYDLGHVDEALARAARALVALPSDAHGLRAYACVVEGLARQGTGDLQGCLDSFHAALEDHSAHVDLRSLVLMGLSFAHWLEGDLVAMKRTALQNLQLGEEHGLRSSIAYARYHLGILHYMRDETAEAEQSLQVVENLRFFASQAESCHATFALALARLSEGRNDDARETVESIAEQMLESGNARLSPLVRAFEAEFDLRVGLEARALIWAQSFSPDPIRDLYVFYVPQLTLAKVRLAEASEESREAAVELLVRLLGSPAAAHNVPLRIQALSLRALAHAADGDEAAALEALTEALELATPGGFVRPFADLGAPLAALLERLPQAVAGTELVGRIRAASGSEAPAGESPGGPAAVLSDGAGTLVEALTNREKDVLELLAQRLRDKEIAEELFIAPVTVKSHLKTLYRKLGVGGRLEAVVRARELEILAGG